MSTRTTRRSARLAHESNLYAEPVPHRKRMVTFADENISPTDAKTMSGVARRALGEITNKTQTSHVSKKAKITMSNNLTSAPVKEKTKRALAPAEETTASVEFALMPRAELQRRCKEVGIRANMKNVEMAEALSKHYAVIDASNGVEDLIDDIDLSFEGGKDEDQDHQSPVAPIDATIDAPAIVEEALIDEAPAVIDEATAVIDEATAVIDEATAVVEEAPAVVEEASAVIDEAPAVVEASSAAIEEAPVVEEAPVIEEAPAVVEAAPAVVEEVLDVSSKSSASDPEARAPIEVDASAEEIEEAAVTTHSNDASVAQPLAESEACGTNDSSLDHVSDDGMAIDEADSIKAVGFAEQATVIADQATVASTNTFAIAAMPKVLRVPTPFPARSKAMSSTTSKKSMAKKMTKADKKAQKHHMKACHHNFKKQFKNVPKNFNKRFR